MSIRQTPWPQGTPSWVDLTTSDREAAWTFYRSLFGWTIVDSGQEYGHYGMAELDGLPVAGIGEAMPGQDQPPAWTTYLASDDIAATAAAITANGGTVVAEPFPVGEQGQMAIAQDPAGALFGIWQAGQHLGCGLVNQPGALVWNECMTRDADQARAFYSAVFGYTYRPMGGDVDYSTIDGDGPGDTVGGIGAMDPGVPAEVPPHWMPYFQVEDADAAAQTAKGAGGELTMGPWDTPFGRMAILRDPQGAVFSIMAAPAS